MKNCFGLMFLLVVLASAAAAQTPGGFDWPRLEREAVENLRGYLRIDTQNPPDNVEPGVSYLRALFEKEGLEVRTYQSAPGKINVLVRLPASPAGSRLKPILLLNHIDVVPVDPARWSVPPFGAAVKDGKIWSRGAMDMKGPGMIQAEALIALKRSGARLNRDILWLATADEETGGVYGAKWMIDHHYAELDPEYVFDEGGFGSRDVFTSGKLVYGISLSDKRPYWLRLTAKGSSGHASQPIPDNANGTLIRALDKLLAAPQPPATVPLVTTMRQKIGGPAADNKFMRAIGRNTISLTTLRAGVGEPPKINVIPSRSEATLDCRLLPGQSADEFLARIKRVLGSSISVELAQESEPVAVSRADTPLYAVMERVLTRYQPDARVAPILVPYSTDGNKFRLRGVTVYGFTPVVIDLATIGSLHSDQEQIPVAEFTKGIHILYDMLTEFAAAR